MSKSGNINQFYTTRGMTRYEVEVSHDQLNKYQVIRGDNHYIVQQKAEAKMATWDEMWQKRCEAQNIRDERANKQAKKEEKLTEAGVRTAEADYELSRLDLLLNDTLDVDDTIDWDSLKNKKDYSVPKPLKKSPPKTPKEANIIKEPDINDQKYRVKFGILDRLFSKRRDEKVQAVKKQLTTDHADWEKIKSNAKKKLEIDTLKYRIAVAELEKEYKSEIAAWEDSKNDFIHKRNEENQIIDQRREKYLEKDPGSITDYCDMVLSNSQYPDYFPQSFDIEFNPENGIIIIDYQFPPTNVIPTLKEVKYIAVKNEFQEKYITEAQLNKKYDSVLYQIALRTVHELFEADKADALTSVVFNGYVTADNPATGLEETACILTMQTNKDDFIKINLANVDPKSCFKNLKGVGSARLFTMTPVAPLLRIDREDRRFVESYDVADSIQEGDNLAAMDWQDFEHLIRELFEKEFAQVGGEVKVTQASRDGGIDAVIFDPDPIRGGKIVIQAKRYTNTVGVSAVRDLYGTVLNEGANKGILVSTADYGADAYNFAQGKPLVLLNGGNLLHMLEKHGHKARINLKEAKEILADKA